MILCKLTSGTTLYCCDSKNKKVGNQGYELDGQFYKPSLLNQPKISFRGNNWIEPATITLQIDREEAMSFTGEELAVEIWLWDERSTSSKFKVFTGVGILGSYDSLVYEYKLRVSDYNLQDDLLDSAPNLEQVGYYYTITTATSGTNTVTVGEDIAPPQSTGTLTIDNDTYSYTGYATGVFTLSSNLTSTYTGYITINNTKTYDEGRVMLKNFGYVKHIAPLLLAVNVVATGCSTAEAVDGNNTARYDGGQNTNYEQLDNGVVLKTGPADVYGSTADVDGTSAIAGSETAQPELGVSNRVFTTTWSARPTAADTVLYEGDTLIVSDQNNRTYIWTSGAWVEKTIEYAGVQGTKPPADADKTADVMNAGLSVTGTDGGLKAGKSSYSDTTTGWFLGRDSGTAKMNVGGATRNVKWDGSNLTTTGMNISTNGTSSTATRLTIIGGTAPSSGLTTSTRLDFTPTEDGQTHFYIWNTSTNTGWIETGSVGIKTSGSDSFIFYATTDIDYRNCFYGKSTSNATVVAALAQGTGNAISGSAVSGYGVRGDSQSGIGVYGEAPIAIKGYSSTVSGTGVYGEASANLGVGVYGTGAGTTAIGGQFSGNAGALKITPQDGSAVTGTPSDGLMIFNNNAGWLGGVGLYVYNSGWQFIA